MPFERAKGIFIVNFVMADWCFYQAVYFQLTFDHSHEYLAEKAAFFIIILPMPFRK